MARSILLAALVAVTAWVSPVASFTSCCNTIDPYAKAAYFTDDDRKFVAAFNLVKESGDVYLHMSAPGKASWYGVGIGESMDDAFMIIAYTSGNGTGVTTSPRLSTGQVEPSYIPDAELVKIFSDSYGPNSNFVNPHGISISHTVCKNCTRFINLDWTSKTQPFIFAIGPDQELHSDEMDAGLRLHAFHGAFTMDMYDAVNYTGGGRVPAPNGNTVEAILNGGTFYQNGTEGVFAGATDVDTTPIIHGAMMVIAFAIIFPVGAVGLRVLRSMLWHMVAQAVGVVFVIVGTVYAVKASQEYNEYRDYKSAHQTIGMLVLALLLLQIGTGLTHHMIFRSRQKNKDSTTKFSAPSTEKMFPLNKFHMFLGPLLLIGAVVNGGLGFALNGNTVMYGIYGGVVGLLFIVFVGLRFWLAAYRIPQQYVPEEPNMFDMYVQSTNFTQYPPAHLGFADVNTPQTPAPYERNGLPYERNGVPYSAYAAPPHPDWYANSPASPGVESPESAIERYHGGFHELKSEESREQLITLPDRPPKSAKGEVRVYTKALD